MLLILTNSNDATADYLASVLEKHGVRFLRFNTDTSLPLVRFSYNGEQPCLRVAGETFRPDQFTNVWYRRPERLKHPLLDDSPEGKFIFGEWAEALEGFFAHIPLRLWMNHPSKNVGAGHKVEQLTTAQRLGFTIPDTLVTQDADDLRAFAAKHKGGIIAKPMGSGYVERPEGQRDSLVYTNRVEPSHLADLDDLAGCPTLFQRCIEKRSDVRITVVDGDLHPAELLASEPDGSQRCDVRRNNMEDVKYQPITLPDDVARKIRALTDHYGLRFAAVDMAVGTDGVWYFFEVNPNGQWAWLDLVGGMNIAGSLVKVFRV